MQTPSLRKRLFFLFLFVTLSFSLVSFLLTENIKKQFEGDIASRNLGLTVALAGHIETILIQPKDNFSFLKEIIETQPDKSLESIDDYLEEFLQSNRLVELVQVLNKSGIVENVIPYNSDFIGLDLSNQTYFRQAEKSSAVFWSNSFISTQTNSPSVTISLRYPKGVVVAQINLQRLSDVINIVAEDFQGFISIVDRKGTIIAHSDQILSVQSINIRNMNATRMGLNSQSGNTDDYWNNIKGLSSVSPVPMTGWSVIVFQPHQQALGIADKIENIILLSQFGVAFVIFISIYLLFIRLRLSVVKFEKQTQQLAEGGDYEIIQPEFREFASVTKNFNLMAETITAREKELVESEAKYRLMIETANEGICFINEKRDLVFVNNRMAEILGTTVEEISNQSFYTFIRPEDKPFFDQKMAQRKDGEKETYETQLIRQDKVSIWVLYSGAPIYNEKGTFMGSLGMVVDISERKAYEDELLQYREHLEALVKERTTELKEANSELQIEIKQRQKVESEIRKYAETQEVLLQEVNHRVKNNLAAIISMLHKEEEKLLKLETVDYSDVIKDLEGRVRGLTTVHQMLSENSWKPLDIGQISENIIQAAIKGMMVNSPVDVSVNGDNASADSSQSHHLALVFNELVTNSIKHGTPNQENLKINVNIEQQGECTTITYFDNGAGFPLDIVDGDFRNCNVGFDLIRGIVSHSLNGEVTFSNRSGAVTTISLFD